MGDPNHNDNVRGKSELTRVSTSKKLSKQSSITSGSKSIGHQILKPITTSKHVKIGRGVASQATSFLLKVARSSLQALQVFCYPPFKWIQRWNPFGLLVEGFQVLSRPLFVLSIATALSDVPESSDYVYGSSEDSRDFSDSNAASESHPESLSVLSTSDTRLRTGNTKDTTPESSKMVWTYQEMTYRGIC